MKMWLTGCCVAAVLVTGCGLGVDIHVPVDYEKLADKISNFEVGKAAFDPDDPLLAKRMILMNGHLNIVNAGTICRQMVYLDEQSATEPVTLMINSEGGDGRAFQCIANMMKLIEAPVDTINVGLCGSAAATIFQSATGKRYAMKDSIFMIHAYSGEPKEMVKKLSDIQNELFARRSNLPEGWLPMTDKYHYFTAEEGLEYGFVDEIVKD